VNKGLFITSILAIATITVFFTLKQVNAKKSPQIMISESNYIELKGNEDFEKEVVNSTVPVLVKFHANWCPPCQMMQEPLKNIAKKYNGVFKIGVIDVDAPENQPLVEKYNIKSMPTMLFIKPNGTQEIEIKETIIGATPQETLEEKIQEHFNLR